MINMKHFALIIGLTTLLASCGLKSKMENQDKAHKEADFIIENFTNYDSLMEKLPEKYFNPSQTKEFVTNFSKSCDWQNRKGKFVDFFTMKNIGGTDQTAFIYEYFLNCDSIRIILIYNMTKNSSELFKINVEPIEKKNQMIIDPSKQLIPQ